MSFASPLGEDILMVVAFKGTEAISELGRLTLELTSAEKSLSADDIVGKNVTLRVGIGEGPVRYFNGFVRRFSGGAHNNQRRSYRAEIVPWLWFLDQVTNCRIFQEKTVVEILEEVFNAYRYAEVDFDKLTGRGAAKICDRKINFCVQYNESDFNFVSRLMEEYGISYYFEHENGKHTLVLFDDTSVLSDAVEQEVSWRQDFQGQSSRITKFERGSEVRSTQWAHADFDYENPTHALSAVENGIGNSLAPGPLEQFEYPGGFLDNDDGRSLATIRMESEESQVDTFDASSTCVTLSSGKRFKLSSDIQSEDGVQFIVTRVSHAADERFVDEADGTPRFNYENQLSGIPNEASYRTCRRTLKPHVYGPQTAIVVGPQGDEIFTDELGRVKVQFHWDRYGKADEQSSCWIRTSQTHAGRGWGALHLPRIGEEVIVEFLNGNPDQPIVTGRVYNGQNSPPVDLPDSKNVCGMVSQTTPDGTGFNQILMDDTNDAELIQIHAQKDQSLVVENELHEEVGADHFKTIHGDRNVAVGGSTITYAHDSAAVVAEEEIVLRVGKSMILMNKEGEIVIRGNKITVNAQDKCETFAEEILTQANSDHVLRGALIRHNC